MAGLTIKEITAQIWNRVKATFATKDDVDALSEEIADLDGNIPDYVVKEAEETIEKVFSHGILGRTIRFIAISDSHEDSEGAYNTQITVSNKHAGQAIKYIADRIGLDFIAHLGDASSAGSFLTTYLFLTLCKDVEQINKFVFSGVRGIKTVFIPGNHDQFYCTDNQRLFNSGAYSLFGSLCEGKKDRVGGYGYFDIEDANVRVLYLNTSDVPSATTAGTLLAMSQEQKNWLCEILIDVNSKDDAKEWNVLLLSHVPLDFGPANVATEILLAYVNGGTYNEYNFANNKAKLISNAHGHVHCYSYGYLADKVRRFAVPNSCYVGNNHYGSREEYESWVDTETYNKTADTGKDTSFSLVTIDLDSSVCYVDNYGAGIDRVFSTDYKSDAAPVNLFDKTDTDMLDRGRINSSHVAVEFADNQLVTGYIEAKVGDTFTITSDKANNANNYTGSINAYDSEKTWLGNQEYPCTTWAWSDDYLTGTITIPETYRYSESNIVDFTDTAYIRFTVAYTDIDSIVITKS